MKSRSLEQTLAYQFLLPSYIRVFRSDHLLNLGQHSSHISELLLSLGDGSVNAGPSLSGLPSEHPVTIPVSVWMQHRPQLFCAPMLLSAPTFASLSDRRLPLEQVAGLSIELLLLDRPARCPLGVCMKVQCVGRH